eukprot:scaffold788_cov56-Attheya_sp.AAC.10
MNQIRLAQLQWLDCLMIDISSPSSDISAIEEFSIICISSTTLPIPATLNAPLPVAYVPATVS